MGALAAAGFGGTGFDYDTVKPGSSFTSAIVSAKAKSVLSGVEISGGVVTVGDFSWDGGDQAIIASDLGSDVLPTDWTYTTLFRMGQ